jgi:hypothetical protein
MTDTVTPRPRSLFEAKPWHPDYRRVYYDTEFIEDGRTIELISIGLVDDRGREYYAVNRDAPWARVFEHPWLMNNVVPHLPGITVEKESVPDGPTIIRCAEIDEHPDVKSREQIAGEVRAFLLGQPGDLRTVDLWAHYGAYDHVALAWLWGPMRDLPAGIPMFTNDIEQERVRLGHIELPQQGARLHNALEDARHNRVCHEHLARRAREMDEDRVTSLLDRAASRHVDQVAGRLVVSERVSTPPAPDLLPLDELPEWPFTVHVDPAPDSPPVEVIVRDDAGAEQRVTVVDPPRPFELPFGPDEPGGTLHDLSRSGVIVRRAQPARETTA